MVSVVDKTYSNAEMSKPMYSIRNFFFFLNFSYVLYDIKSVIKS